MTQQLSWGDGLGSLWAGFRFLWRRPRLALLGAVPPAITSLLLLGALVALLLNSASLATWVTPFADGWDGALRQAIRVAVAALLVVAGGVLGVLLFATVTLALGAPIYDRLSEEYDDACGGIEGRVDYPLAESLPRAIRQGVVSLGHSLLVSVAVFALGLLPAVGTAAAVVAGALLGGWLVARDLSGGPLERRGQPTLRDRARLLASSRRATLGFGVPVYLLLLVPILAILAFPAAAVGATVLVRRLRGEPDLNRAGRTGPVT